MSRSLSRSQAVLLGLCTLAALGLAGFGLFAVGSRGWYGAGALTVRAGFRDVRGVEVGTRVRIRGVDAGEVVAVETPDADDAPVILRMRVGPQKRHLVRSSSVVQIVAEGMLGGKVVEIRPGPGPGGPPADDGALLASRPSEELADVIGQVGDALRGVQQGRGTVGKLLSDPRAYDDLVALLRSSREATERGKETMTSIQRDADALKRVPLIGRYVEDPTALLVRANCERNRKVFAEAELFEPGRAVLTASGREALDGIAGWLEGLKHKGSDVVVASFADPRSAGAASAGAVTRQQSEAVIAYLQANHKVHKLGWFSWRKVTALGMGAQAPPAAERDPLPAARVEVIVFVPQT